MRTTSFLVVDDNNVAMKTIGGMLVFLGATHVETTCGSRNAVDVALAKPFDLIIAGYGIPAIEGLELFRKIRQNGCETPFLLITDDLDEDRRQEFAASGLCNVIQKPFDMDIFSNAVYTAMWSDSQVSVRSWGGRPTGVTPTDQNSLRSNQRDDPGLSGMSSPGETTSLGELVGLEEVVKKQVLFLCTGNSCRSQMAEGFARMLRVKDMEPYSAGVVKHGMNPLAVKVMAEAGVDISGQFSKTVDELPVRDFDYVITLCGHANENCPYLPGKFQRIHAGFDDPPSLAKEAKTEEEALGYYRQVRDEIKDYVSKFSLE